VISKGQVLTHYYRIMNKNGGYTWIQTCATVICSSKNADEQNIICVNYVISAKEHSNLVLDCCQQETVKMENTETIRDESGAKSPDDDPTNDKGQKGSNLSSRNLTSPKSEVSDQHTPKTNANMNTRSSNNVQNTNIVNETTPVSVKEGASTRGRKRKMKAENAHENDKADAKIQIKNNLIADKQISEQPESSVSKLLSSCISNAKRSNQ
jgi:neuronal PAS domain-containing protein 1/3